jgi:tRNA (guanine37-N1)-methyltransferase
MRMRFDILTLFPNMFFSPLQESILGKAIEKGLIQIQTINIRHFTLDKHRVVDDIPYGGGQGMVMKVEPIARAIESIKVENPSVWTVYLTPQGKPFNQDLARRLSTQPHLILLCGRYEGVDERVRELFIDEEISIGDYVLTGGELPAMVLIDAVSRFIPGVLGSDHSAEEDSFFNFLLEYPQFTRPFDFKGSCVPEVLLSGNHSAISLWRRKEALRRTSLRRPDLLAKANLSEEDKKLLGEVLQGKSIDDRACLPDRQGMRPPAGQAGIKDRKK